MEYPSEILRRKLRQISKPGASKWDDPTQAIEMLEYAISVSFGFESMLDRQLAVIEEATKRTRRVTNLLRNRKGASDEADA